MHCLIHASTYKYSFINSKKIVHLYNIVHHSYVYGRILYTLLNVFITRYITSTTFINIVSITVIQNEC